MIHTLHSSSIVPLARERVFAFFADPTNLARITPPEMGFSIRTPEPIVLAAGAVIEYRIRVLGVPLAWRSLIESWDPPREFVDVQLAGPYKRWSHTHRFWEHPRGTAVDDLVRYEVPCQPLGELGHRLVRRKLEGIFRYRQQAILDILGGQ